MSGYERSDANVRGLAFSLAGLFVLLAAALAVTALVFAYLARQRVPGPSRSPVAQGREVPPQPRLQVTPYDDLSRMRAAEEEKLSSYGWVDRTAGVVRIPIDRAIELTLARGLPYRGQSEQKKLEHKK